MKGNFFNFKIMITIFLILLTISLIYLSNESTPELKEVTKNVEILKTPK